MDVGESNERGKDDSALLASPRSPLSSIDLAIDGAMNASIEQLYHNVCEMESSDDQSPSRASFISYGAESRIDLELRHLVGDVGGEGERKKEIILEKKEESIGGGSLSQKKPVESLSNGKKVAKTKILGSRISSRKSPDLGKVSVDEESPELGVLLLKQARELVSSGENLNKALDLALRAVKVFEKCGEGEKQFGLNLVMSLHILAAIYAGLGRYNDAVPVLERSIEIPMIEDGEDHALAKFAGCMQLGDMYGLMGQVENSILLYTAGLEIQRQVLGESDARVGETCRYLAEAHVQAMQFEEASRLCQMALDIHKENGAATTASIEEAADRKLMGLICDAKGDYEVALEHYVLASMAMSSQNHREDVASVDCSIGDAYMSLARFDEAIFAYQKALAVFKQAKGETHSSVASVYVRLADLYNKIGKIRDSKSYCENALKIYLKPTPGTPIEEVATGFIEISAIYQSMNELDQSLKLLRRALKIYANAPGQQNTIAGIEAQMGVISYMMGNYPESYNIFKSAISKFRNSGEKKTALFGIALNQMGLACVQRYAINEAADLFEEAKTILEKEYGPYHPDTLAVYSNLAGTYDAMGRLDDAIEILEYVVGTREEKLGTANPEVEDEKQRLAALLKEAGRGRSKKNRALLTLLDKNPEIANGQRPVY
ncbi:Tetratricopeptide repeat-containing domain [Arabidopsis thaliana x Arabidopsis arenosa]|uniref:Tetratricopeptide repeat-containing domain n=1 Tax=Arabidopsis thaliana x Arabidopsis arenosa TaxID=1240361 RepID=A0A8T1ZLD5_9BRAS|nr:Tetratricopeptide repeat-containing domain [Arabidopsis thaliana x Arabidopsis arenosa]